MPRLLKPLQRVLALWLPRFPVQRRLLAEPALRRVPLFVVQRQPRGLMTVACWAWAAPPAPGAEGGPVRRADGVIRPGMPLAEAFAVLAGLHGKRACERAVIDHDDPSADRTALVEIARWCRRFSPAVAVEESPDGLRPECLWLDVTATAGFFGGEERLARTAVWMLAARGIHARAAIADTPGAAWAAAHHVDLLAEPHASGDVERQEWRGAAPRGRAKEGAGSGRRRHVVVPRGAQASCDRPAPCGGEGTPSEEQQVPAAARRAAPFPGLGSLPAAALRLDGDTLARLQEVGIDTIGEVVRLPRKSLASRFGHVLARRLAEFAGERAEPPVVASDGQLPQAGRTFDFPLSLRGTTEAMLGACIASLLEECVRPLVAAGRGVTTLQVRLERHAAGRPAEHPGAGEGCPRREPATPVVVDVGLFRPSVSVPHLAELVRLRMSRMSLPAEIEGVAVEVVAAADVVSRQRRLFGDGEPEASIDQLLDRLSGRLGRAAVFEPRAVADAQPEHAWIAVPPCAQGGAPRIGADEAGVPRPAPSAVRSPRPARDGWPDAGGVTARRPPLLLSRPVRLETAARPAGGNRASWSNFVPAWFRWLSPPSGLGEPRRRRVLCAQGPERIETAWWRGPCVRRDYFLVECAAGDEAGGSDGVERFWIYRRLRDDAWFLHGIFA